MDSFDVTKLKSALEDVGVQLSWASCQNFIANLIEQIPDLEAHTDIINSVASRTFQSADISIVIGSSSKPSRNDAETCQKVLQSGANKGRKCSLPRTINSEFCKRHLNMMMKADGLLNDTKQKQINSFRDVIGAKRQQRRLPAEMKLRAIEHMEDVYVDLNTKLIFAEIDNKMMAIGHMYDDEMTLLSKKDIKICDLNGWEYRLNLEKKKVFFYVLFVTKRDASFCI
uniref:Uncharacterized protein n=1 Tax=Physcomitrium patens TaxID=3218 RepID=A0A2K1L3I1_PHYPA|nr:hypothetical protein PHYPA_003364 [Physcomitrium patens]